LTDRPHQEISAKVADAASAVEADDAVITGQHHQERAGSLSSEEQHSLGPAGDRYNADDRRAWRGLPNGGAEW
jgi:hypothetical protein